MFSPGINSFHMKGLMWQSCDYHQHAGKLTKWNTYAAPRVAELGLELRQSSSKASMQF